MPPVYEALTCLIKISPVLLTQLWKANADKERSHGLTLRANVKVIAKIKSQCSKEQKTCLQKKLSRSSLRNWCNWSFVIGVTPTQARKRTSVKQYVDPPPP